MNYEFSDGSARLKGAYIKDLPDKNFKIEIWFKTWMANAGIFSFDFSGNDRHFVLKEGKPYNRIWGESKSK